MLSKADSLKEVINFFNPIKAPVNFPFYRPLTTQFYFWLGKNFFGLNPIGYHLVNFLFFLISLFLVYFLARQITNNLAISYLTTFFYTFSSSHFYRLYFLSQFQEIGLTVFYLLTVIFYFKFIKEKKRKDYIFSFLTFILAITAKETAITLPLSLLLVDFYFLKEKNFHSWIKNRLKIMLPFLILTIGYLSARFTSFGFSQGAEYKFVFNPKSILNNIFWYFLWSMGIPEHFVNMPLKDSIYIINPGFLTDVGKQGALTTLLFVVFLTLNLIGFRLFLKERISKTFLLELFSIGWFLITLILVMFFPFHKFSYSTTLPLFAVSIFFALTSKEIIKFSKFFFSLALFLFLLANNSSYNFALETHWAVKRANIAKKIFSFFQESYPELKNGAKIYFFDYDYCAYLPGETENSEEISYVLSKNKGLEILYNKDIDVFFQYKTPIEEVGIDGVVLVRAKKMLK